MLRKNVLVMLERMKQILTKWCRLLRGITFNNMRDILQNREQRFAATQLRMNKCYVAARVSKIMMFDM